MKINNDLFYFETLPLASKKLWPYLKPVADLDYVLYGGTAISLRLGHRISIDFDFFSSSPQDKPQLLLKLPFLNDAKIFQDKNDLLSYKIFFNNNSSTSLSFFNNLSMGRVGIPTFSPDGIINIASLDDLLAFKIKVVQQRIQAKDYQDIAALCQAGYSLLDGLAAAKTLFPDFSPILCAKSLIFFEGGDLDELSDSDKMILVKCVNELDFKKLPIVKLLSKDLTTKRTNLDQNPKYIFSPKP